MNTQIQSLFEATWPQARAGAALTALAAEAGLDPSGEPAAGAGSTVESARSLDARIAAAAREHDLEVDSVETPYAQSEQLIERGAPALLRVDPPGGEVRILALLRGGRRPLMLAPDGTRVPCSKRALRDAWCKSLEDQIEGVVTPMLDATGLTGPARSRARRALLHEHLAAVPVGGAWLLRRPPGRPLLQHAREAGLPRLVTGLLVCGLLASALSLVAWIPLARGIFTGRLEPAWVVAWALLLASALPLRWLESWFQVLIGVRFGRILRWRLMAGATRLAPEDVRGEGAGKLLGRVLESESLESLLLSGGFVLLGGAIDVALAGWVLTQGPAALLSLALFGSCLGLLAYFAFRHRRHAGQQADVRLGLTSDLVERMNGQRTRIVQERREDLHTEEDRWLSDYIERSRTLDGTTLGLTAFVASLWIVLGSAALAQAFVAGSASSMQLAIGVGAVLLGSQALLRLSNGLSQLSSSAVAWRLVRPLFDAARRNEETGLPRAALVPDAATSQRDHAPNHIMSARDLSFRHAGRHQDVLHDVHFDLSHGDRVLVEGPSGGGKSTLIAMMAGLREPRAGSLTLHGLDRRSHGAERWRRQVTAAPQFHENHVFGATFAFNLLLASPEYADGAQEDFSESLTLGPLHARAEQRALKICAELGLDEVLKRMPSGMRQNLGETGWQLSHGERSRLFVARALLADAPLVVLDESLSALDPVTAARVLACVHSRCDALVVAAHP